MLYNTCYITFAELLYNIINIQVWLSNIQDGYIIHPNPGFQMRLSKSESGSESGPG